MPVNIAVVYYSATGAVHRLAEAVAEGASQTGAGVRLRQVSELTPAEVIASNPAWQAHHEATKDTVAEATLDDLEWAHGFAFGTPTRFGTPAAQLKQFIDTSGGLWSQGRLADKPVTSFTSAMNAHGGQESTILALNNVFYHWGCFIIPPGYTDDTVFAAGGNPYGASWPSGMDGEAPNDSAVAATTYQGRRVAETTSTLRGDG